MFLATVLNSEGGPQGKDLAPCSVTIRDHVLFVSDKFGTNNPWHAMEVVVPYLPWTPSLASVSHTQRLYIHFTCTSLALWLPM